MNKDVKKETTRSRTILRYGGYSIVTLAVVLAVVILVNLGVRLLPATATKFATDGQGIYDISDVSRRMAASVKDPITLYLLASDSTVDRMVKTYVERYSDLSVKLTVKTVDLATKVGFLSNYTDETVDASLTHVLMVNEKNGRSRLIPYSEIYYQQYSAYEISLYQMYYGTAPDNPTYFQLEDRLTSALDYVTTENLPVLYYTSGHGEAALDKKVQEQINKENIELKELTLTGEEGVPDEASAVLIYIPTMDFGESEIEKLRAFAGRGGNLLLITYFNTARDDRVLTNLYAFAAEFGMTYEDVLVLEGNSGYYLSSYGPLYLTPVAADNSYTDAIPSNTKLLMAGCHGITLSEGAEALLTTTDHGYAKRTIDENTTQEKQEDDPEGKYVVGALGKKDDAKMVWFTSYMLCDEGTIGYYANVSYFMAVIDDFCEKENAVSIEALALQIESLGVSERAARVWGVILIGLIPVAVLAIGFWIGRKRVKR